MPRASPASPREIAAHSTGSAWAMHHRILSSRRNEDGPGCGDLARDLFPDRKRREQYERHTTADDGNAARNDHSKHAMRVAERRDRSQEQGPGPEPGGETR